MKVLGRYVHGSEDSLDLDVYYWVDEMPETIQECKEWCAQKEGENANLFTVRMKHIMGQTVSFVDKVYKGTPDEVNNSLIHTYHLHPQTDDLPEGLRYTSRDCILKYIRSVRIILSHLSRSKYRDWVKNALDYGNWDKRLETLRDIPIGSIDFSTLNKNMSAEDIKKVMAFQIGQSLGLMDGNEYYTKSRIAEAYPILKQFLYRDPDSNTNELNAMVNYFVKRLREVVNEDIIYTEDTRITFVDAKYDVKEEKRIW